LPRQQTHASLGVGALRHAPVPTPLRREPARSMQHLQEASTVAASVGKQRHKRLQEREPVVMRARGTAARPAGAGRGCPINPREQPRPFLQPLRQG
jgi:hypothetical protein